MRNDNSASNKSKYVFQLILLESKRLFSFSKKLWNNKRSRIGMVILGALIIMGIFGQFVTPYSPYDTSFTPWQQPSLRHLLGTDYDGADVFSMFLFGTGTSLLVGFSVAVLGGTLGILVGVMAGFFESAIDNVLMRFVDILLVIPAFPLLVIFSAYFPPTLLSTVVILSIFSWPYFSRVIRSQTLTLKQRTYVTASKLCGLSSTRLILREIIPNLLPLIFINLVFLVVVAVAAQAGLAFFGLGDLSSINWGTMLYWFQAEDGMAYNAWGWILSAGVGIILLGLGGNLLSNGMSEITRE